MDESIKAQIVSLTELLQEFLKLPEDWDGYKARTANPVSVTLADEFIKSIPVDKIARLPHISLTGDGNASVYWSQGDLYTEFHFDPPDILYFTINTSNHAIIHSGEFLKVEDAIQALLLDETLLTKLKELGLNDNRI